MNDVAILALDLHRHAYLTLMRCLRAGGMPAGDLIEHVIVLAREAEFVLERKS